MSSLYVSHAASLHVPHGQTPVNLPDQLQLCLVTRMARNLISQHRRVELCVTRPPLARQYWKCCPGVHGIHVPWTWLGTPGKMFGHFF